MCDKALAMCQNYDDLIEEAAKLLRFYAASLIGEPYLQINRLANDLEYQALQISIDEYGKQNDLLIEWKSLKKTIQEQLDKTCDFSRDFADMEHEIGRVIADDDLRKKMED